MRVAVCGVKCVPSIDGGGVERGVIEVCRRLSEMGVEVLIFSRVLNGLPLNYCGFFVKPVSYFNSKYLCYQSYMASVVWSLVRSETKFDLVHVHSPVHNGLWVIVLKLLRFKVVAHTHGPEWRANKWSRAYKLLMKICSIVSVLTADQTICVSPEEASLLTRVLSRKKMLIDVIPNGIPEYNYEDENPQILCKFDLKQDDYIVFVGRIVPQKRVLDLIEAYNLAGVAKKLLIIGDGSFSSNYVQRVRDLSSINDTVILTGSLEHKSVMALIKNASFMVLPSETEGCPNVLLEAIACGTACVVSDIAAHRIIGKNRLNYFRVGDVEQLASQLRKLAGTSLLEQSKEKVTQLATHLPNWNDTASAIYALYEGIIDLKEGELKVGQSKSKKLTTNRKCV